MQVEFNKVTWYSKLLAIIIFVGTFFLGYWLGQNYATLTCTAQEYNKQVQEASKQVSIINTAVFACPKSQAIYAVFTKNQVQIKLSDGRAYTLPQVISADGGRYANADESFVFWNKGNGAFITENGKNTYDNCVTQQ